MNAVVLTAATSAYNSGFYSNGRMFYGLSPHHNAPVIFLKTNKYGALWVGILASLVVADIAAVLTYFTSEKVFSLYYFGSIGFRGY
ncbi:hypothetical protein [Cutibacterium modestum]|uniref:hypothetical protein n=1 Tax=Cutibacterium modestum TaxID=2559073 RepID=UPI001E65287B|nr:hypothetical protein [Cutibacterium modestum]